MGPGGLSLFAGLIAWNRRVDPAAKLTRGLLFQESWPGTAWRTLSAIPELSHIDFYKALLEFTYRLGIKNVALVHLHDEGFELIFHGGLSFFQLVMNTVFK